MDIMEVLQWNSVVCNRDIDPKLSDIEKIIKSKLEQESIRFMIIESSRVIMKIDTVSGIPYALWDRSYWNVYSLYLSGILNIAKDEGENGPVRIQFENRDYLTASIYLFLALTTKDDELSKKFAYAYRAEMSGPGSIMMGMSLNAIFEHCEIAQYFVAMHEKTHYLLKSNKILEKNMFVQIEQNIKIAKMLISNMTLMKVRQYYGMSKGQMLRLLNSTLTDDNLKKDIICDAAAFNECLVMFLERWERHYSKEQIINKCLETIRVHGFFSTLLNLLETFWNDCEVSIDTIQEKLLGRVRRYDVSELVFMIQLSAYEFDFSEAMKPDNFVELDDKNPILQKIMSRFINDQIRDSWKQLDINIEANNKYELLEWRI